MDLRKIFGPVAEWYTSQHNEELYNQPSSPNSFRLNKSRRLKWSGHVARIGERRGTYDGLGTKT